ncbi:MAG: ABC transporter substrate-binding protein [Dehalococcoidia bacterium]
MNEERKNYWSARVNRRRFIGGSFGIAALGGLVMAGCSSSNNNSGNNNKASTTNNAAPKTAASASAPASTAATQAAVSATKAPSAATTATGTQTAAAATKGTVNIGAFIDRSGPTANVGNPLGNGVKDWADFKNANGGANGYKLNFVEFDHKYDANIAQQGYTQYINQDKVVMILSYGTPITDALKGKAADDKVPMMTPGYGLSDSSDGTKYPYLYVGAASYQAQMRALLQYISDDWKAKSGKGNAKLAYLYYDNAAGLDPIAAIDQFASKLNVDAVAKIPVPPTAVDLAPQFQQAKDKNPDYLVGHLFGAMPALGIKAWKQVGLGSVPLIGMVWAFGESDIATAADAAEGYYGLQFTAMPEENPPALQMLRDYWKKIGRAEPEDTKQVYYLRGVFNADIVYHAASLAGDKLTGESMKSGMDQFKAYTADGLSPGITMTKTDHGGTNKVKLYQVKGGKITLAKDWFEGPSAA